MECPLWDFGGKLCYKEVQLYLYFFRDHTVHARCSNVIFHWLGSYTEWSLLFTTVQHTKCIVIVMNLTEFLNLFRRHTRWCERSIVRTPAKSTTTWITWKTTSQFWIILQREYIYVRTVQAVLSAKYPVPRCLICIPIPTNCTRTTAHRVVT